MESVQLAYIVARVGQQALHNRVARVASSRNHTFSIQYLGVRSMFTATPLVKKGSTNLLNAMLVSLGLLLLSQTALAQEDKKLIDEFELKNSDASGIVIPDMKAKLFSDGTATVSGSGEYQAGGPTFGIRYEVDLKQKAYKATAVDPKVLKDEKIEIPQAKDESVNIHPEELEFYKTHKDSGSVFTGAWITPGYRWAKVRVRTFDPVWIKLTETTNSLTWYTYSSGSVISTNFYRDWWAANPSSLGTNWYVSGRQYSGPYTQSFGTRVYHSVSGSYYNYNFMLPSYGTFASQSASITGRNDGMYNYSWSHTDSGEGSWLIYGSVILN